MYNDEIQRLQKSELSLDDLDLEDSLFMQESKLKRKVSLEDVKLHETFFHLILFPFHPFQLMKIYEKLCELKGCSTLTGRVIEQRITYSRTRYPEINKRVGDLFSNQSLSVCGEGGQYIWIYLTCTRIFFFFPIVRSSALSTVLKLRRTLLITRTSSSRCSEQTSVTIFA